ncbi:MAG TPA: hypothetical protein VHC22_05690 [Pirellulales bacterium]|nr:hypothetical protein [Pirellulales bacterium]
MVKSTRHPTPAGLMVWLWCVTVCGQALAIAPGAGTTDDGDWPPLRSPAGGSVSAEESPEDQVFTDPAPAYRGLQRPPREYLGQSAQPPEPLPSQVAPMPAQPVPAPNSTRAVLSSWLPEGLIPGWSPTPDSRKDRGIGGPLKTGSWRSQPFSISGFAGATNGGPLINGHVLQRPSFYGGANFGWDYDHYWGIEKRLGFGDLILTNGQHQPLQQGLSVTGEYRVMWYPLGDARWRPFLTTGIGWSDFYFQDDLNRHHLDTLLLFPFGGGLKYQLNERLALRIDMIDELTFAGGAVNTFHYVALTAGLEVRYGKRLLRMPWHKKSDP